MKLDDRLRTVLEVAADSDASARAQYQQLVDLLGSGKTVGDGTLIAASFLRLAALARRIPAADRAEMLADPALRLRSPPLVAQLCEGEPEVAAAAIEAAELDDDGWTVLTSVLGEDLQARIRSVRTTGRARGSESRPPLLRSREPKRTSLVDDLTKSTNVPERMNAPAAMPARPGEAPAPRRTDAEVPEPVTDIADIVARIERFRTRRRERMTDEVLGIGSAAEEPQVSEEAESSPPPVAAAREVDCRISPEGRINWASRLGPMLTGLILSASDDAAARVDEAVATALRRQQAIRSGRVMIAASPAISGEWRLDAAPNFDPVGRFLGYHARLTRKVGTAADSRGDLVRQALHELRTPINALQGFAEIIQQQLFGPVPHQYRSLAAGIAGETATLLAALEEVERLVRLRRGTRKLADGETAIGPLIAALAEQLQAALAMHGAILDGDWHDPNVTIAADAGELERSLWRLMGIVAGAAREGERLRLDLSADGVALRLAVDLPDALAQMDDETLYGASPNEDGTEKLAIGLLGRGFALRLVTAEARAAGGNLDRNGNRMVLTLPCEAKDIEDETEAVA